MTGEKEGLLARLQAAEEAAKADRSITLKAGPEFAVRYELPSDTAFYRATGAEEGAPAWDDPPAEQATFLEVLHDEYVDFLASCCIGLYLLEDDGAQRPLASLREDGDETEPLTFQHPEAVELIGGTVRDTTRANAKEFFRRALPRDPHAPVNLHVAELTRWRTEALRDIGDVLLKG